MTSECLKLTAYLNDMFAVYHRTLRGDKVIMLTHTYKQNPLRKINATEALEKD